MLVEDSDDDAFFFERAFALADVAGELLRLPDGGAAVAYLERALLQPASSGPRHVLFLDLKLPVLSGFDVLHWIRERSLALEVIVLSGSDLESDVAMARQLGASDYLVKPISPEEIRKRLALSVRTNER